MIKMISRIYILNLSSRKLIVDIKFIVQISQCIRKLFEDKSKKKIMSYTVSESLFPH